jgi:hypothetical protein
VSSNLRQSFCLDPPRRRYRRRRQTLAAGLASLLAASSGTALAQSWTPLNNPTPDGAQAYEIRLLTDGTVMVQNGTSPGWLRLTPDADGSYIDGSWDTTSINPMSTGRGSYPSEILQSGKVWIFGGENYGPNLDTVWTATGEMWDPLANTWSPVASFPPKPCFEVTYNVNGTTASGSPVITGIAAVVTPTFVAGWSVQGPGIPDGATIASVDSSTQVTMSAPASATQAGVSFAFSGVPVSCFGDVPTMLLPGGKIFAGSLVDNSSYIYTVDTNSWAFAANKVYDDSSDEETWVRLADGRILTYDIGPSISSGSSIAEIYSPKSNTWSSISPSDGTASGTFPLLSSIDSDYELGPSLRLLDGRIFLIGATGHTALYTPSSNSWASGPDIIGSLNGNPALFGADDAPAAVLPNGHVLLAADAGPSPVYASGDVTSGSNVVVNIPSTANFYVSWAVTETDGNSLIPPGTNIVSIDSPTQITMSQPASGTASGVPTEFGGAYSPPTELFDFDPVAGTISAVSPALPDPFLDTNAYNMDMLMLPTGQLLFTDGSYQAWIYTPAGSANPAYQPVVTNVAYNGGGVFTLTGTQLTGSSAGASYGDDAEMDENYPIVALVSSTGQTYYCRTSHWSAVNVGSGSMVQTVDFTLNAALPPGTYSLVVSAAGIASAPTTITITVDEVSGGGAGGSDATDAPLPPWALGALGTGLLGIGARRAPRRRSVARSAS